MKAWLITWEAAGQHAEALDKVAGLLNPRWPAERVAHVVEFLYARSRYDVQEMAYQYAKYRCEKPYKAEVGNWELIHCGHNPHLLARKVKDLAVEVDPDTELETITWTELARRNVMTGEVEEEEASASYTRSIGGPVSDRLVQEPSIRRVALELDALLRLLPGQDPNEILLRALEFDPSGLVIRRP